MDKLHIDSLDVLKSESDLIKQRDQVFEDMTKVIDILQASPCFPSLLWAWTFDILHDICENNRGIAEYLDEVVPDNVTLKQVFDKLWDDVDHMGITMDSGGEILEETIRDWMRENNFLVALDDDAWLDEPNTFDNVSDPETN